MTAARVGKIAVASVLAGCALGVSLAATPAFASTSYAAAASSASANGPADSLISGVLSRLGSEGAGLLLKQLGMKTDSVKLDEMAQKLNAIEAQLNSLQSSVDNATSQIHEADYGLKIQTLTKTLEDLKAVYIHGYQPLGQAAVDVATAREALAKAPDAGPDHDAAVKALDTAQTAYNAKVNFFENMFNNSWGAVGTIHGTLNPMGHAESLITAYGKVLFDQNRYLTSAQSQALQDLYNAVAQYEALGAWMKAEAVAAGPNPQTLPEVLKEFKGNLDSEAAAMPPAIPAGVVIDRGASTSQSGTTANKTMFLATDGTYKWLSGDSGQAGGAVAKIKQLDSNSSAGQGFTDWQAVSGASLQQLFANFRPGTSAADYLNTTFGLGRDGSSVAAYKPGQAIWQADHADQQIMTKAWQCGRSPFNICHTYNHYDTHYAYTVGATGVASALAPKLPSGGADWGSAKANAAAAPLFDAAQNRLIVSRNTGNVNFLATK